MLWGLQPVWHRALKCQQMLYDNCVILSWWWWKNAVSHFFGSSRAFSIKSQFHLPCLHVHTHASTHASTHTHTSTSLSLAARLAGAEPVQMACFSVGGRKQRETVCWQTGPTAHIYCLFKLMFVSHHMVQCKHQTKTKGKYDKNEWLFWWRFAGGDVDSNVVLCRNDWILLHKIFQYKRA